MTDNQAVFDDEEEYNPDQLASAPQKDFGPESDDEYKPTTYTEPTQSYDYSQPGEEVATGYGAERAQLMAEEPVSMPSAEASQAISSTVQGVEDSGSYEHKHAQHMQADARLKEATEKAKNTLISEINQYNYITESSGAMSKKGFEDEENADSMFSVSNAIKMNDTSGVGIGQVVKYTVTGQDSEGKFEVQRRFKEFDALHRTLNDRWPGCYIPAIPEKALDNKDDMFVELRRSLLERFLRECAKYEFLIESKEFKIFSRTAGEVDGILYKLPRQSPIQILEKYRLNFKLVEEQDNMEVAAYRDKINIFSAFLSKAIIVMNKDRKSIESCKASYDASYKHYKQIYGNFATFENLALDYYCDGDMGRRVLTHPSEADIIDKIKDTINSYKNPFAEAALWIKGEMLDIQGMIDAMKGREKVMKAQINTENKKRDDQQELEKLSLGKATLKSFFKSKSGKEKDILNLQANIEQANTEIEDYRKLINFITIYHGHLAIDKFKKDKSHQYARMLNLMSVREISNAFQAATLNHRILELQEKR